MSGLKNQKKILFLLTLGIFIITCNPSYSVCEIIKARTLTDINEPIEKAAPEIYTFNDPDLPNFIPEESIGAKVEKKTRNFFKKRNPKNKENITQQDTQEEIVSDNTKDNQSENKEVIDDKNKFFVEAQRLFYDEETGILYAEGNVKITAKQQDTVLCADEAILDKNEQTVKLYKNIKIIKQGAELTGESMTINLNEQNILVDDPVMEAYSFNITAQEGYLISNNLQMLNGTVKSSRKTDFPLITKGFMQYEPTTDVYTNKFDDFFYMPELKKNNKKAYRIEAKEIVLTSYKDHNSILLKGSNVYYNNKKIVPRTDIEIISDKQHQVIETNAIEAGTMRNFGMYIGYGLLSRLPKGQSLKLMPALTYGNDNIGVGLIGRYRSQNGILEAGWNTSSTNLVARGKYKFTDNLRLDYGRNAYIPDGFMGANRSGYAAQLAYEKGYRVDDLDAYFTHGIYAGIFNDYRKHKQEKAYATTRFRYMASMYKTLAEYKKTEQDFTIKINANTDAEATLYGSGQTQGVVRIGPSVITKYKRWNSAIGYYISGVHGESPFDFDKYRYGKSTITVNEKFNLCDKLSLGFKLFVTPLKDNPDNDLLTETRLYAIFGPQDLKLALSYDFVRDVAHLEFMMLLGSESAKIDFDKLITKNLKSTNKHDFYKKAKKSAMETENI